MQRVGVILLYAFSILIHAADILHAKGISCICGSLKEPHCFCIIPFYPSSLTVFQTKIILCIGFTGIGRLGVPLYCQYRIFWNILAIIIKKTEYLHGQWIAFFCRFIIPSQCFNAIFNKVLSFHINGAKIDHCFSIAQICCRQQPEKRSGRILRRDFIMSYKNAKIVHSKTVPCLCRFFQPVITFCSIFFNAIAFYIHYRKYHHCSSISFFCFSFDHIKCHCTAKNCSLLLGF